MKILKNVQYYVLFAMIGALGLSSCQKEDVGIEELKKEQEIEEQASHRLKTIQYGDDVTDADGNTYRTVIIGNQRWLEANLRTTKFANGDPISYQTYGSPSYVWYNHYENYKFIHGGLYNFHVVDDERPLIYGWKSPTKEDWETLKATLGVDAGGKMKSSGQWLSPNIGYENPTRPACNESGFNAIGGGQFGGTSFSYFNISAFYWASEGFIDNKAWIAGVDHWHPEMSLHYTNYPYNYYCSIRLVKDENAQNEVTVSTPKKINRFGYEFNGELTVNAGGSIIEYGFCYSRTNQMPDVNGAKVISTNMSSNAQFSSRWATEFADYYYVRAYVETENGITYSEPIYFWAFSNLIPIGG